MKFSKLTFRFRWLVLTTWIAAAGLLVWFIPSSDKYSGDKFTFMPEDTPHGKAIAAMRKSFPERSGLSEAVVVFERKEGKLLQADLEIIDQIAGKITSTKTKHVKDGDIANLKITSPKLVEFPKNPLTGKPLGPNPMLSKAGDIGQAALLIVDIPANFVTARSARVVSHIRTLLQRSVLPEGLSVAVTGSSGFGYDYAEAAEKSHQQTLKVTLAAVIIILLLVYGAPIAAMVPLVAISIAAIVAVKLLDIGEMFGMHVGTAEKIFVFVLIYGAGIDYSLLLISRYREFIETNLPHEMSAPKALVASFAAIFASAGTDIVGLSMLSFATFGIFKTTGPAVAVALFTALLAAITLVPAMVGIIGRPLFWPKGKFGKFLPLGFLTNRVRQKFWPKVAAAVTARPRLILVVTLIALAIPAYRGGRLMWVYDTLTGLKLNTQDKVGNAAVGMEIAKRHWSPGQIAPVKILLCNGKTKDAKTWQTIAGKIVPAIDNISGVSDVRSIIKPLGDEISDTTNALVTKFGQAKIQPQYISRDFHTMRLMAILDYPALSPQAMETVGRIRQSVSSLLEEIGDASELHIAGASAEMIDIQEVTQSDFYKIAALVLAVIFVMVMLLLRDALLSAFMVASTVLSYLATLGICYWVFAGIFGAAGLDWKVEVFLFVVMVAVGQDYNIFLAARLAEEARRLPTIEATRRAVAQTGPVISSCGIIMAATLGSLMVGDITLLTQLGFAFALGMLIDTFVVRPLLLPTFAVITNRTGKKSRFIG